MGGGGGWGVGVVLGGLLLCLLLSDAILFLLFLNSTQAGRLIIHSLGFKLTALKRAGKIALSKQTHPYSITTNKTVV